MANGLFECCHQCHPPKRNPGCHSDCPEYLKDKAEYDKRKAAADKKRKAKNGLTAQRAAGVNRAMKSWKVK